MWVVIYVAKGKTEYEKFNKFLTEEGFLTKTHKIGKNRTEEDCLYEISVTELEAQEAQEIIYRGVI